jgi:hypothetical protein
LGQVLNLLGLLAVGILHPPYMPGVVLFLPFQNLQLSMNPAENFCRGHALGMGGNLQISLARDPAVHNQDEFPALAAGTIGQKTPISLFKGKIITSQHVSH